MSCESSILTHENPDSPYQVTTLIRDPREVIGILGKGIKVELDRKDGFHHGARYSAFINANPAFTYEWWELDDPLNYTVEIKKSEANTNVTLFDYSLDQGPVSLTAEGRIRGQTVWHSDHLPVVFVIDSESTATVITDQLIVKIVSGKNVNRTLLRASAHPLVRFAFIEYDCHEPNPEQLPLVSQLIFDKLKTGSFAVPGVWDATNELALHGTSLPTISAILNQEGYAPLEIGRALFKLAREHPSRLLSVTQKVGKKAKL